MGWGVAGLYNAIRERNESGREIALGPTFTRTGLVGRSIWRAGGKRENCSVPEHFVVRAYRVSWKFAAKCIVHCDVSRVEENARS